MGVMKRPRKMKKNQGYYVLWLDACFSVGEPEKSCSLCRMLGWFVREDERGLVFAMEIAAEDDGTEEGRYFMSIPHGMVVEVRELAV